MAIIASQDFNDLTAGAFTTDSLPDGSALTNTGASSAGGPGLDFQTFWFDTRGEGAGPVTSNDSSDFIGVNDFAGSNAPDVAADGTPVATGTEQNFEFNDGDGRLDLVFEPVDLSGETGRTLTLGTWINDTGFESDDRFQVTLSDGTTAATLLDFGETELESKASADDGTANWTTVTFDLDSAIADTGLDDTALTLTVSVDTNAGSETIFIDDVTFEAGADAPAAPDATINELRISSASNDDISNFVEVVADPQTDLDGLTLVVISGEFEPGQIDVAIDLKDATTDAEGFALVAAEGTSTALDPGDITADFDFFGSPSTFQLVEGFTGAAGADLDTDNDGTLDTVPWDRVTDSVSLIDGDSDPDVSYSDTIVGPDGSFTPAGAARIPDETGAFTPLDFSDQSADTPGSTNTPAPSGTKATIMEIQGAGHVSPFVLADGQTAQTFFDALPADTFSITGEEVTTTGLVTAVDSNGFYLQDPVGDGDIATSDGIFVFTGGAPGTKVGDAIAVTGTVAEFFPGDTDTRNLPTTELVSPEVTVLGSGKDLPEATVIGQGGRIPPSRTIDDDAFAAFEPELDGIDVFESIEGMRVTAQDAQAIAPTNRFGEIFAVADNGADATGLSDRGTLNIAPDDFNPEKIQIDIDDDLLDGFTLPEVAAGALLGDVTGVVSYDFGNFQIHPTEPFTATASELAPETTTIAAGPNDLTVASYNVLNLDPNDSDGDADVANGRFDAIARQIVTNLNAPDVIALQEVQDNDGAEISEVTSADQTLQTLVDAIAAAGGPDYEVIDTPGVPADSIGPDGEPLRPVGGQPGGTIRNAFLYNPERVELVDGSVQTITDGDGDEFPFFEGRIPLEASFTFNGETITLINNHLSSKGGSAPLLGIEQPFDERQEDPTVNGSLDQRQAQAQAVADRVAEIQAADPDAKVSVLGDLNEFEFISPVAEILGANLTNLVETLPEDERYSFIFQGNSQQLDHILVSDGLSAGAQFDIVHTNSEFAETESRASDHDPLLASFDFTPESPVDVVLAEVRDFFFGFSLLKLEVTNVGSQTITDFELGVDSDDDGVTFLFGFGREDRTLIRFDPRDDTFEPVREVDFEPGETLELRLLARGFDDDADSLSFDVELEDGDESGSRLADLLDKLHDGGDDGLFG